MTLSGSSRVIMELTYSWGYMPVYNIACDEKVDWLSLLGSECNARYSTIPIPLPPSPKYGPSEKNAFQPSIYEMQLDRLRSDWSCVLSGNTAVSALSFRLGSTTASAVLQEYENRSSRVVFRRPSFSASSR